MYGMAIGIARYIRIRQEALRKLSRRIWYTKLMQILVAACYHFA